MWVTTRRARGSWMLRQKWMPGSPLLWGDYDFVGTNGKYLTSLAVGTEEVWGIVTGSGPNVWEEWLFDL